MPYAPKWEQQEREICYRLADSRESHFSFEETEQLRMELLGRNSKSLWVCYDTEAMLFIHTYKITQCNYRHCHLKWHLFKQCLTDEPNCERCLGEDESATHILCDCEAIASLTFRHLGQFFVEPSDYYKYNAPTNKVLHFIRSEELMSPSKWPRGLRHELSSLARTLGSWVRIPLKAWMSVCIYSMFVLPCV
jgi:hypothetical protein